MTTRLDRLFVLLDQGSSQVTRKAAALELGEVQRLHPHELNNLLSKVRTFLHSSSWETRVAAGQAVEAIVSNVEQWNPQGQPDNGRDTFTAEVGHMSFDHFDVNLIIANGKHLLASEGKEYDDKVSLEGNDWREKVVIQRKLLNSRLGLPEGDSNTFGINSEDLVTNDDLMAHQQPIEKKRQLTSEKTVVTKKAKKEVPTSVKESREESCDKVLDMNDLQDWPLEWFADELMNDLFSPLWEVRHGAATGLREVVKLHGTCAGKAASMPSTWLETANQSWLEDLSLRLICVLALDKFGDFVSDQVVAPVRETCAQALGSVFNAMLEDKISKSLTVLVQLLQRPEWEARHGGLLGLKYLLAIRQDLTRHLLPTVFQPIFNRLKDSMDDVSAVAAAALVPVKDVLIECLPEAISTTLTFLWDALLDIDDLTSSTSSILMLLSSLLSFVNQKDCDKTSLSVLIPRLWPFLGHSVSSVRKSVLEALITLTDVSNNLSWLPEETISNFLGLIFQRSLVESNQDICELTKKTWREVLKRCSPELLFRVTSPFISGWICLVMHPSKLPIEASSCPSWVSAKHSKHEDSYQENLYLGGSDSLSEGPVSREKAVIRSRMMASSLLGLLAARMTSIDETSNSEVCQTSLECLSNILLFHLSSKSAVQRICSGLILIEWAQFALPDKQVPKEALEKCTDCLQENVNYDEVTSSLARVHSETREFVALLSQHNILPSNHPMKNNVSSLTVDQINSFVSQELPQLISEKKFSAKTLTSVEEKGKVVHRYLADFIRDHSSIGLFTSAVIASALVSWSFIPDKLNPLIRPLMDSIKKDDRENIQDLSAANLAKLLKQCPGPAPKVIKNLVTFLCCDPNRTPSVFKSVIKTENEATRSVSTQIIMTLNKLQKVSERANLFKRSTSVNKSKIPASAEATPEVLTEEGDLTTNTETMITTRGAATALVEVVKLFGVSLKNDMPCLWTYFDTITRDTGNLDSQTKVQNVIESLQVLEVTAKYLACDLQSHLVSLLDSLCILLKSTFPEVRHMASRCFGVLSMTIKKEAMNCLIEKVVLDMSSNNEVERMGSVEAVACVIEALGLGIVPYIVLLVCPMLSRMSDQCEQVRLLATHCFAQLVQLMPLDSKDREEAVTTEKDDFLTPELLSRKRHERTFLDQLLNPKKLENFEVPIKVNADLRSYQQDGVNWLAFLNKFNLQGILCDEMGLGKTLMSICILASDHAIKKKKSVKCGPSLVVCPPTLTGHWAFEVDKFVSKESLSVIHYTGSPPERMRLKDKLHKRYKKQLSDSTLVVASYDIVRNDIDFFSSIKWNYCILDEGHIIKNGKTKLSKAIKSLIASHRLILTGTPIQNNVLELWSLFDFLMPGFLGTEKQFMARYSRPILASRDAKSSSKEQEAGVLAMESLHRQALPFILRRMKEDVLKDLPPKIIQDYYCELSPLQSRLYEDFAKSRVKKDLEKEITQTTAGQQESKSSVSTHVFQALQYLRKVCNHPKLVLNANHAEYQNVQDELTQQKSSLSDINHAAKLVALQQLLQDCGIGVQASSLSGSQPVVNQHRALIFCQLKSMLDIVENDLLKTHLPSVSFLRLDGNIAPGLRHSVVHRFNNDPSIDVLLLTTQVCLISLPFYRVFKCCLTGWRTWTEFDRSRHCDLRRTRLESNEGFASHGQGS